MLTDLLLHLEDVLFAGHSGVVVKMAGLCLRSTDQQSEMMKTLLVAFHAQDDPNACIPLFLTLTAYEAYLEHEQKRETDKDIPRVSNFVHRTLLIVAVLIFCWTEKCTCAGLAAGPGSFQVREPASCR